MSNPLLRIFLCRAGHPSTDAAASGDALFVDRSVLTTLNNDVRGGPIADARTLSPVFRSLP